MARIRILGQPRVTLTSAEGSGLELLQARFFGGPQNDDWGIGVKLVRRNEGRVGAPWAGATVGFRLWLP
jgi:hypothetical protein